MSMQLDGNGLIGHGGGEDAGERLVDGSPHGIEELGGSAPSCVEIL